MSSDYFSQLSYLAIEINSTCNLKCKFCNREEIREQSEDKTLELKEFVRTLDFFKKCPLDTIKIQGLSEPFLNPHFDRFVQVARDFFPNAFIISSTNLQGEIDLIQFESVLDNLDMLYFSIDGVGDNYERLRAPGRYSQLLINMRRVASKITDNESFKKIFINVTVSEENVDDLPAIYELSAKFSFGGVRINIAQNWNQHEVSQHTYSKDFVDKLKKYTEDIQGVSPWMFSDCYWPSEGLSIDAYGDVRSCLLNTSQVPLGNIWNSSIRTLYNQSSKYNSLRASLQSNTPCERCQNCDYALLPPVLDEIGGAACERIPRSFSRITNSLRKRASGANILFVDRKGNKFVRKWIDKESSKLLYQYEWLKLFEDDDFAPSVLWSYSSPSYFGYEMEMIEESNKFSDLIFRKDRSCFKILDQVFSTLSSINAKKVTEKLHDDPDLYYEEKVLGKMEEAKRESNIISGLMNFETIMVNDRSLSNYNVILNKIGRKRFIALLKQGRRTLIHGDFTAENLLVTKSGAIIIIDPNNENAISTPLVDYAKLFQSLKCGYEEISNLDLYKFVKNEVLFKFKQNSIRDELCKQAWNHIPTEYHTAVNAHLAIHFARLLPYQIRSKSVHLPVYYAIFISLLNEVYEQLEVMK